MNKEERLYELSALVKKLVGERSIRKTGAQSGVAASYINDMIKCKYLPSAETLRKLTTTKAEPRGGVTLEQLMVAAGYQQNANEVIEALHKQVEMQDLIIKQQRKIIDELTGIK